tara:strand:+ start:165 stop:371 length:207 start_codon:yes stop_codon:yes gene_type:complete
MRNKLREAYRDWANNFLTIPAFAENHGITAEKAQRVIRLGKILHNREAERLKSSCSLTELIEWSENNF